jgi:hypothetical protein
VRRVKSEHVLVFVAETAVQETFRDGSVPPVTAVNVAFVIAVIAALAGTVDIRPNPNDATATSAMRFRSVFVDIIFPFD